MRRGSWVHHAATGSALALALVLTACSSSPHKPQPAALPAVTDSLAIGRVWTAHLGEITTPLQATVLGHRVLLASSQGLLLELDGATGREAWRMALHTPLVAGVGSDGKRHAVVTADNALVVVEAGKEIWRQRLHAQTFTAPLVAGERVFVQTADRTVMAFDGVSGQRLWTLQRNADPLVLRQAGVLTAVGDTLLAGNGGRLTGIQPLNGQVRWDVLVGSSRGTNEVERLVDLVAGVSRQSSSLCVRSFQTAVACIDTARGQMLWSRPAQGHLGLDGDDARVFGVESDSKLRAWHRADGQLAWSDETYRFRGLTAPRVWGSVIALGDEQGAIHLLSREQGKSLQRMVTDGTPVAMQPVLAGQILVTVNRSGLVSGWRRD